MLPWSLRFRSWRNAPVTVRRGRVYLFLACLLAALVLFLAVRQSRAGPLPGIHIMPPAELALVKEILKANRILVSVDRGVFQAGAEQRRQGTGTALVLVKDMGENWFLLKIDVIKGRFRRIQIFEWGPPEPKIWL